MFKLIFLLSVLFFAIASSEIYFQEEFGDGWENRWVVSKHKTDGTLGEVGVSAGKFFHDPEADKGLQTKQDAKFYQLSAATKEFSNRGKTLVVQFSAKHEQNIDCGGGYVKILPAGLNQEDFNGDSQYNIMFGPDICGTTKRIHVIFHHNGKNHLIKREPRAESDEFTHLYTLIVRPNQTYEVLVDNKQVQHGSLLEDWDFLAAKEILDPSVSKPSDWVNEKEIDDPSAVKPEGWDDIPAEIKDPNAVKPEDWDAELDGDWEAPTIANPDYKGEWKAPKIPNPAYKGEWVHPKIPNPEYKEDDDIYAYDSNKYIGIEIWQVKSGTIFDNFLLTDSVETAASWAEKTLKTQEGEKAAHEKDKEERKAAAGAKSTDEDTEDVDGEDVDVEELDHDDDDDDKDDKDEL